MEVFIVVLTKASVTALSFLFGWMLFDLASLILNQSEEM